MLPPSLPPALPSRPWGRSIAYILSVQHAGPEALKLVSYKKDAAVIAICETWAGSYDNSAEQKQGFEVDDAKTGFANAVGDFKAELQASK